ncbi:acyl-CoA dehydrogenase family protein [Skermania piniformis]|uniref:Acyl-CoA dehydrogenase n=1 Tax=Skermania pinensis TaxID=39122 RepID=A0ABX8SEA9_9ACTN|nr:acyl-CoA dehydrogenase family protein [Skermania piniformis]QXQ15776.1 acyl-CoA dehydrogenase [Skermania piniformis]
MVLELSEEATEFGLQAIQVLRAAGGDDLVQAAEADPTRRQALVEPVLARIGAWELAPRRDPVELEAAAALCRSAGYWATPYPVAERLARPDDLDVDLLVAVAGAHPAAALAGIDLRVAAVDPGGRRGSATVLPAAGSPRETGFVAPLSVDPVDESGSGDLALAYVLPCWTLLGLLDRAMELAREHVLVRQQFGRPLAEFQSVQFQLTDAEVERRGVEVLARYALWSMQAGRPDAVADALALRVAALEAADVVFRVTHQLHGALGFCDETTLSWLSRHSLALRRLPFGRTDTEDLLTRRIGTAGLAGLYSDPPGV